MNRIGLSRESSKLFIDTIELLKLSRRRRRCFLWGQLNNLFQHWYWHGRACVCWHSDSVLFVCGSNSWTMQGIFNIVSKRAIFTEKALWIFDFQLQSEPLIFYGNKLIGRLKSKSMYSSSFPMHRVSSAMCRCQCCASLSSTTRFILAASFVHIAHRAVARREVNCTSSAHAWCSMVTGNKLFLKLWFCVRRSRWVAENIITKFATV